MKKPANYKDPYAHLPAEQRTRVECWSRTMGYHRPISQWNAGKRSEWAERTAYKIQG